MYYFAGPIEFSPMQQVALAGVFAAIIVIVLALLYLFISSTRKTLRKEKIDKKASLGRFVFTIGLPIWTILSFVAWMIMSMATKEARYSQEGVTVSDILAIVTLLLFGISLLSGIYYRLKKF